MANDHTLKILPKAREGAVVQGACYRFTVLTDRLIRMEYQENGLFTDNATQTVLCRDFPVPEYRVVDRDGRLEILTEKLRLCYDKKPFSPEGLTVSLREAYHIFGSEWRFGDEICDLKGTARTLDGADGAIGLESGLLSRFGFTVLDDSKSALLSDSQWVLSREKTCQDLYFFGYGHDYLQCLKDFYRLSGETPLLPRYALGNWWSRYYKYSEESYLELMEAFRQRNIPFSVAVVDMDWHLTDIPKEYGSGWTGYTWDPALFPDPKRFLDALHRMGLHVTLNVHPAGGVRPYEDAYLPMAEELGVDSTRGDTIPFEVTNRRFMDAYFKYLHHPHEEQGVDFWWIDWQQGNRSAVPGVDPLWMLNHLHFLDSGREGHTPLILSRYAGIGSHRYPLGFSGDSYSTWESLDFQPYFTATASNVGYTWWSHDIGGHQRGRKDDELVTRWVQFGVFSPIMRLHSTSNPFFGKEPWNYGPGAEFIMTRFLRLRHRLVPYLYSMNYRTHLFGEPLIQPMYYRSEEPEAYQVPNEYWFGSEMIVCPITKPASRDTLLAEFDAWLPEGWFWDLFTGQLYRGGRELRLYRDLNSIPVLVKAGGILPLAGGSVSNSLDNPEELEILVFSGADGAFDLYEDGGSGREAAPVITHMRYRSGREAEFSLELEGTAGGVIPANRVYTLRLRGIGEPVSAALDSGAELSRAYDAKAREFVLRLDGAGLRSVRLRLTLPESRPDRSDKMAALYALLQRAQISYDLKDQIFSGICREPDMTRALVKLTQMDLDPDLEGAIIEQLVSDL